MGVFDRPSPARGRSDARGVAQDGEKFVVRVHADEVAAHTAATRAFLGQ